MFSVGATPFNSKARQLYGGWTADQAGDNLWGVYKANSMQAKYGAPGPATKAAKDWMKNWRRASKLNPAGARAVLRASAGEWLKQRKRRPMTAAQKQTILEGWNNIPFVLNPENAYNASLYSGATYPPWPRLMANAELTYPAYRPDDAGRTTYSRTTEQILGDPNAYFANYDEYRQSLRDRIAAARGARGVRGPLPPDDAWIDSVNAMVPEGAPAFVKVEG